MFNSRFEIRYTTQALSSESFDDTNGVVVYTNNHINIQSNKEKIQSVIVHDLLG